MIGLFVPIKIAGQPEMDRKFWRKVVRCHNITNSAAYAVLLSDELYEADLKTLVPSVTPEPPKFCPNPPLLLVSYLEMQDLWREQRGNKESA